MTTADNNVSEPPNLNIFWGTPPPPPITKDQATTLGL